MLKNTDFLFEFKIHAQEFHAIQFLILKIQVGV